MDWHSGVTEPTVLVIQQHLHSASVSSHNNPLIQLTECGQGQNHLTVTSLDSATGKRGCGEPMILNVRERNQISAAKLCEYSLSSTPKDPCYTSTWMCALWYSYWTSCCVLYTGFELWDCLFCVRVFFFLIQCKVHVWGVILIPNQIKSFYIKKKSVKQDLYALVVKAWVKSLACSQAGARILDNSFLSLGAAEARPGVSVVQTCTLRAACFLPGLELVFPRVLQIIISSDGDNNA